MKLAVPRSLQTSIRIAAGFPIHLLAAFFATLISDILMTIQPMFLRSFIDLSQGGVAKAKLWPFPVFMASAAALAFLYDYISIAIRYFLQKRIAQQLEEIYIDYGDKQDPDVVQLVLRRGIPHLSQLALSLTIDFVLIATRIGLILLCLGFTQPGLAGVTLPILLIGIAASWITGKRMGRIVRTTEIGRTRVIAASTAGRANAKSRVPGLYAFDEKMFNLKAVNSSLTFAVFRVMPISALAIYLMMSGLSLGALSATFIYFSMLRSPYKDFVDLLQEAQASLSESTLFSAELDKGAKLHAILSTIPVGLVCTPAVRSSGAALSRAMDYPACREFFDDFPVGENAGRKNQILQVISRRSRAASICVHSDDPAVRANSHFFYLGTAAATTVLHQLEMERALA